MGNRPHFDSPGTNLKHLFPREISIANDSQPRNVPLSRKPCSHGITALIISTATACIQRTLSCHDMRSNPESSPGGRGRSRLIGPSKPLKFQWQGPGTVRCRGPGCRRYPVVVRRSGASESSYGSSRKTRLCIHLRTLGEPIWTRREALLFHFVTELGKSELRGPTEPGHSDGDSPPGTRYSPGGHSGPYLSCSAATCRSAYIPAPQRQRAASVGPYAGRRKLPHGHKSRRAGGARPAAPASETVTSGGPAEWT
eukprot:753414-Hanusia_phi.AAC.1